MLRGKASQTADDQPQEKAGDPLPPVRKRRLPHRGGQKQSAKRQAGKERAAVRYLAARAKIPLLSRARPNRTQGGAKRGAAVRRRNLRRVFERQGRKIPRRLLRSEIRKKTSPRPRGYGHLFQSKDDFSRYHDKGEINNEKDAYRQTGKLPPESSVPFGEDLPHGRTDPNGLQRPRNRLRQMHRLRKMLGFLPQKSADIKLNS